MKQIALDYYKSRSDYYRASLATLAISIICLMVIIWGYITTQEKIVSYRLQESKYGNMSTRQSIRVTDKATKLEIREANVVLTRLTLPWKKLFASLEGTGNEGIALLSIEPDTKKGDAKIGGEARDLKSILAYMRRLEATGYMKDVYLLHHAISQEDNKSIKFVVVGAWMND